MNGHPCWVRDMRHSPPLQTLLQEASEDSDCVSVMGDSSIAPTTVAGIVTAGDKKQKIHTLIHVEFMNAFSHGH